MLFFIICSVQLWECIRNPNTQTVFIYENKLNNSLIFGRTLFETRCAKCIMYDYFIYSIGQSTTLYRPRCARSFLLTGNRKIIGLCIQRWALFQMYAYLTGDIIMLLTILRYWKCPSSSMSVCKSACTESLQHVMVIITVTMW